MTTKDKKTLTADEVISEITDILKEADGDFIEHVANQVLGRKVKYIEDSNLFQKNTLTTHWIHDTLIENKENMKTIKTSKTIKKRLEYLKGEIKAERISYGEITELQSLSTYIDPNDVLLLEAAGVPETFGR